MILYKLSLVGVDLYFDQHLWIDELDSSKHGCCWPNFREQLSVRATNLVHVIFTREVNPGANDVPEVVTNLSECLLDYLKSDLGLAIGVALVLQHPVNSCGRARDVNVRPDFYCSGVANDALPWATRRNKSIRRQDLVFILVD